MHRKFSASPHRPRLSRHCVVHRRNRCIRPHFSRCDVGCVQWQAVIRCSHSWCNFMAIRLPICVDDDDGETREIRQGEGGEQGDPLMPMLYVLGQHQALRSVQFRLRPHERLLAFHDDVYAVAQPERIVAVHRILGEELWQHSRIRINAGKTQIWNRGGHVPSGYETLLNEARAINPHAEVWFGGSDRPPEERGIRVLGTPLGTAEFVRSQLDATEAAHQLLLQRIPAVQDLQSAWLLLLFCASSRATFYLRPDFTEAFARQQDLHTWQCLSTLLEQRHDAFPQDWGSLPFHLG